MNASIAAFFISDPTSYNGRGGHVRRNQFLHGRSLYNRF